MKVPGGDHPETHTKVLNPHSTKLFLMKITFLGTSGGRFVMITQFRATGGFIVEMDGEMIHVDPGPGALVRAAQNKINLRKLTGIIITHTHPDHSTDAEVVTEAMTLGTKKKRGILIGNEYTFKSSIKGHYVPVFCKYHLNALEKYHSLKPGQSANIGNVKISAVKTKHRDSKAIGIIFEGSEKIGYTSDTEYFKGLEDYYRGCDYLIVNCLRPRNDGWPDHMNINDAEKLIRNVKPKVAIITHVGIKLLKKIDYETKAITKNTGVKTISAKDNMILDFEKHDHPKGLDKFMKGSISFQ